MEIEDKASLGALARRKRQLLGKTMQTGDSCGADVFLRDSAGVYLGRVCSYKKCAPGIRASYEAQHCGKREFLCDDLQNVMLDSKLMVERPLDLWPEVITRIDLPEDVDAILAEPLRAESKHPF